MNITIGTDALTGRPYRIDPTRHINILGGTGVGKSSLQEHIFLNFISKGYGGLLMDVHGDTADRMTYLVPSSLKRDFIYFNPSDDAIPTFNPLYFQNAEELELAIETVLTILRALSLSDSAWGNETPHNVRTALDTITELVPNPNLLHVYRFLLDPDYRDGLISQSKNPLIKLWQKQFNKLSAKDQASKLAPAINKLSKLMRPTIMPVIANDKSIDPLQIMNERKVMVCRISKGQLGEETAMIFYSFIVSMFSIAALRREKQKVRTPFIIVADEAQNGVHGGRFGTLLAEARKYGISLVTAFQSTSQMPIMAAILTNSATQICFQASGTDAEMMAQNWQSEMVIPKDITELSRYEFYSRTFEGNQPIVKKIKAPPPLRPLRKSNEHLLAISRNYWATPKKEVQKKIDRFLASS